MKEPSAQKYEVSQLYTHTLDSLCNELVKGNAVTADAAASEFRLDNEASRKALIWYRANQNKWAGNVFLEDIEKLVEYLSKPFPKLPPNPATPSSLKPTRYKLVSLKAHRFAGIHKYGLPEKAPPDFTLELNGAISLWEGENGVGKTSALNAITWCLTGYLYRAQRAPESGEAPIEVQCSSTSDERIIKDICPVTPLPPKDIILSLQVNPISVDTWVELVFVDGEQKRVTVRRKVERSGRGKLSTTLSGMEHLQLDPIAVDVSTKMMGVIPYIQLGSVSDLGQAVARLTGIKPLQNLARHAKKAKEKLENEMTNNRRGDIRGCDLAFASLAKEFDDTLNSAGIVPPAMPIPTSQDAETVLETAEINLDKLQSEALAKADAILGSTTEGDQPARKNLAKEVGPAIGLLDTKRIAQLATASRLHRLSGLPSSALEAVEKTIAEFKRQAEEIVKIEEQPDLASRVRLYARVAAWIREQKNRRYDSECALCGTSLENKVDHISNRPVSEHLSEFREDESDFLEKTLIEWERFAMPTLISALPPELRNEAAEDALWEPRDVLARLFGEELLESDLLSNSLAGLKDSIRSLAQNRLLKIDSIEPLPHTTFPKELSRTPESLVAVAQRIEKAIALARWRMKNEKTCREMFDAIVGRTGVLRKDRVGQVNAWPLRQRLEELADIVADASPLAEALTRLKNLQTTLKTRRTHERRVADYGTTSEALTPLLSLDQLVERQVAGLMKKLDDNAAKWKSKLYAAAHVGVPKVVGTEIATNGALTLQSELNGTRIATHHIANASDLRASLMAIVLAFWQHLVTERSGLDMLCLNPLIIRAHEICAIRDE